MKTPALLFAACCAAVLQAAEKPQTIPTLSGWTDSNAVPAIAPIGEAFRLAPNGTFMGSEVWARQVLAQAGAQWNGSTFEAPAYAERGFRIDVARKFVRLSFLYDLVKLMSYYRMNTLHVHLNDNAFHAHFENDWRITPGFFRLECETYPGLTSREHYTKAEFRTFVKEAAKLGVAVIPEIDTPAHSLAFSKYRPSLASKTLDFDHLDLENPELLPFMKALFDEYITGDDPVFVHPVVHVGGDEYRAKNNDAFRAYMKGLIAHVKAAGKTPRCWGAPSIADLYTDGVQVDVWFKPRETLADAERTNCDLIAIPDGLLYIVPLAPYYHDWLNVKWLYHNWAPNIFGGGVTLPADNPRLRGACFALWNDRSGNGVGEKEMIARILPAMQVLSEKMWHGEKAKLDWEAFSKLATQIHEPESTDFGFRRAAAGYVGEYPALNGTYTAKGPRNKNPALPEAGWFMGKKPVISFRVKPAPGNGHAELFRSPNATFYLRYGKTGRPGFSRDGYIFLFDTLSIPAGKWSDVEVAITPTTTALTVNGVTETMVPRHIPHARQESVLQQRTLFFPLAEAGGFDGELADVKIIRE